MKTRHSLRYVRVAVRSVGCHSCFVCLHYPEPSIGDLRQPLRMWRMWQVWAPLTATFLISKYYVKAVGVFLLSLLPTSIQTIIARGWKTKDPHEFPNNIKTIIPSECRGRHESLPSCNWWLLVIFMAPLFYMYFSGPGEGQGTEWR